MGMHAFPVRRFGRIGLVALLGLTLALVTVSAGHANASSWHKVGATAAKKKCKKKHRSAAEAKKKKCKKKKKTTTVAPPAPAPPAQPTGPITRLELSWSGAADIDAHAWSNGLHDGWNETLDGGDGDYEVQIPGTTYTGSFETPNRETIVETNPNPLTPLTFSICYYAGDGGTDAGETDLTAKFVFADGSTDTDELTVDYGAALTRIPAAGGPTDPAEDWCPSPI